MKEILNSLFQGNILDKEQSRSAIKELASGKYSDAEIASFLTVYLMRKITPVELLGFREGMLDLCVLVEIPGFELIDVCGTGGDEKNTFNISTLSAFVLAGAGLKVAKHGNYAVSSPVGSSNIFEYFGYRFSNETTKLRHELEEANICYMHAPLFHPAMKNVAPVRKSLKMKTFFNLLGPLSNPARPNAQYTGVFSPEAQQLYADVFKLSNMKYTVVYSHDGYDEISLTSGFKTIDSVVGEKDFLPQDLGFETISPNEIDGGNTIETAADIFIQILKGNGTKAQVNVVVANSAFAIQTQKPELTLKQCIVMATDSLNNGAAYQKFNQLIQLQK